MSNAVVKKEDQDQPANITSLALQFADRAIETQKIQRAALKKFVRGELRLDSDFGNIPGCSKPSLFKPGAEKLANLFQLGSKIVHESRDLDLKNNWAMFTYRIEVFHLPTGKTVAQCEGSANSQERKYKSRAAADNLNTLQKMAQKRAYVGAVLIACGASDFFTQDVEDMDLRQPTKTATEFQNEQEAEENRNQTREGSEEMGAGEFVFTFGVHKGKRMKDIPSEELKRWYDFWSSPKQVKNLRGAMLEAHQCAKIYLEEEDIENIPY